MPGEACVPAWALTKHAAGSRAERRFGVVSDSFGDHCKVCVVTAKRVASDRHPPLRQVFKGAMPTRYSPRDAVSCLRMGIRPLLGRFFTDADHAGAQLVLIVNHKLRSTTGQPRSHRQMYPHWYGGYIVLRSALPPEQIENALRTTVRSIDLLLPLTQVQTKLPRLRNETKGTQFLVSR
jgi:hypothetical protein